MVKKRNETQLARYGNPFSLMDEMDDVFENLRSSLWGGLAPMENYSLAGARIPAIDIMDKENALEITAELPGINKGDLDIEITEDSVYLKAETKEEKEEKKGGYYKKERYRSSFQRKIPLPVPVDVDKADAEMKDGVLLMSLPKKEAVDRGAKKLTVK